MCVCGFRYFDSVPNGTHGHCSLFNSLSVLLLLLQRPVAPSSSLSSLSLSTIRHLNWNHFHSVFASKQTFWSCCDFVDDRPFCQWWAWRGVMIKYFDTPNVLCRSVDICIGISNAHGCRLRLYCWSVRKFHCNHFRRADIQSQLIAINYFYRKVKNGWVLFGRSASSLWAVCVSVSIVHSELERLHSNTSIS